VQKKLVRSRLLRRKTNTEEVKMMEFREEQWMQERQRVAELRPMDPVFMQCMFAYNPHLLEKTAGIILQRRDLVRKGRPETGNAVSIRMRDRMETEIRVFITGEGFLTVRKMMGIVPYDPQKTGRAEFDIRIAENDVFGQGWPVYCFESGTVTRLYINGQYRRESALSCLLHDFRCRNPDNMLLPEMILTVRRLKESETGIRYVLRSLYSEQPDRTAAFG